MFHKCLTVLLLCLYNLVNIYGFVPCEEYIMILKPDGILNHTMEATNQSTATIGWNSANCSNDSANTLPCNEIYINKTCVIELQFSLFEKSCSSAMTLPPSSTTTYTNKTESDINENTTEKYNTTTIETTTEKENTTTEETTTKKEDTTMKENTTEKAITTTKNLLDKYKTMLIRKEREDNEVSPSAYIAIVMLSIIVVSALSVLIVRELKPKKPEYDYHQPASFSEQPANFSDHSRDWAAMDTTAF